MRTGPALMIPGFRHCGWICRCARSAATMRGLLWTLTGLRRPLSAGRSDLSVLEEERMAEQRFRPGIGVISRNRAPSWSRYWAHSSSLISVPYALPNMSGGGGPG